MLYIWPEKNLYNSQDVKAAKQISRRKPVRENTNTPPKTEPQE